MLPKSFKKSLTPLALIFIIGSVVRILLALVNREAFDNHIEIMLRMLNNQPVWRTDCWECFQPKLYHGAVLLVYKLLSQQNDVKLILIGQMLSALSGIGTLMVIRAFITKYMPVNFITIISYALIVFNPSFIGINIQATNDSFVIFFSTLAIYALWRYLKSTSYLHGIILTISVCLAVLSKGSGFITYVAASLMLLLFLYNNRKKGAPNFKTLILLLYFNAAFVLSLFFFSPYIDYYKVYGSPFIVGIRQLNPPAPPLFHKTYYMRPGITSVTDGYLTFRLDNLLAYPFNTYDNRAYPLHRTSYWSQLYGQFNSLHFFNSPFSWRDNSKTMHQLTRLIFIFALPLTAILILGYVRQMLGSTDLRKNGLFFIFFSLFLISNIFYSYVYRDFSFIKPIFLLPAIICLPAFVMSGIDVLRGGVQNKKLLKYILAVYCVAICALYLFDSLLLFDRLKMQTNEYYCSIGLLECKSN